jgi:hypothetical protein
MGWAEITDMVFATYIILLPDRCLAQGYQLISKSQPSLYAKEFTRDGF